MAQDSYFWTTDGTGDGASGGYTMAELTSIWRALFVNNSLQEGVLKNTLQELEVTDQGSQVLQVNTGWACVYGFLYSNTAVTTAGLTTPSVATTGWRMVVRANWAAQQARVTLLESSDGTGAAPGASHTGNTNWDITLATGSIATNGDVTVVDGRFFCHFNTEVEKAMIADAAVSSAKIATGAIATAKLADDAVTGSKAGNRVPQVIRRQGGSATVWSIGGSSNYTPGAVRIQGGANDIGGSGYMTITLPTGFSYTPLIFAQSRTSGVTLNVYSENANAFSIAARDKDGNYTTCALNWLAIGPE